MLGTGIIKGLIETGRNFAGSYYQRRNGSPPCSTRKKNCPRRKTRARFLSWCTMARDAARGHALHGLHDLRAGMPPAMHPPLSKIRVKKAGLSSAKCSCTPKCSTLISPSAWNAASAWRFVRLIRSKWIKFSSWPTQERFNNLLLHKAQLSKPNTYFQKIHPTRAAEIDAQRAEDQRKAAAKAKATPRPKRARPPPPSPLPQKPLLRKSSAWSIEILRGRPWA